jgi:hypothetical protein
MLAVLLLFLAPAVFSSSTWNVTTFYYDYLCAHLTVLDATPLENGTACVPVPCHPAADITYGAAGAYRMTSCSEGPPAFPDGHRLNTMVNDGPLKARLPEINLFSFFFLFFLSICDFFLFILFSTTTTP